jgi:DNA repair exonuclease SbcCD ATPase subunit
MKILSLVSENIKRLVAVEIRPDGNLVQITGKNRQGKTSILDSIWWALTGTTHIQKEPIRKGASEGRIRLDLGELKVTRTFRRKTDGNDVTTSVVVENEQGARFSSPQTMLDSLLGALSFDPLAFSRMKPREQFDALRRFVPEVNFEAIAAADKKDRDDRKDLNRRAEQERAAVAAIVIPSGTPSELVDESALVDELTKAGEHNTDLAVRRGNRARIAEEAHTFRADAVRLRERADELELEVQRLRDQAEGALAKAAANDKRLADAPPLPEAKEADEIRERLKAAQQTNINVRKVEDREKHRFQAEQLENQAEALTLAMEQREKDKRDKIAAAQLPVEGVGFGDGVVLLNGVPFDQASDAEQLDASVKIAMAMNSKLRVIRIRDGSLLDDEAMQRLARLADEHDMQVWIERVDSSGRIGFVIEDGQVKAAEEQAA